MTTGLTAVALLLIFAAVCAVAADDGRCGYNCGSPPDCSQCTGWSQPGFCTNSEQNCEGPCNGYWCSGSPPPPPPSPPSPPPPSPPSPPPPSPSPPPPSPPPPSPPSPSPPPPGDNPLAGHAFYVNPTYVKELESSIMNATGTARTNMMTMMTVGSAYWLDTKAKVQPNETTPTTAAGIFASAARITPPPLVTFIVYDLPNRDCHAKASNGEICCNPKPDGTCDYEAGGDCADGLKEYMTSYITPLAASVAKFCGTVPMALVIEPDSLPNLATNQADPHCGNTATSTAYRLGIPYAIKALAAACPTAPLYLDAAHGGWLGWDNNLQTFARAVQSLKVVENLRGFSTNVANYQPLGTQCPQTGYCLNGQHQSAECCADPCKLEGQYNPANNEMNFVQELAAEITKANPGFEPHFIVDTGRNGVADMRSDCANWCNIRGAGVGLLPTTSTADERIDAYMWLKTPGESDGCTQQLPSGGQCSRYDSFCGSTDSIGSRAGEPYAPEAGKWFDFQIEALATNAHMTPQEAYAKHMAAHNRSGLVRL